jgi:uncharacterized protein (TIGR03437 family)
MLRDACSTASTLESVFFTFTSDPRRFQHPFLFGFPRGITTHHDLTMMRRILFLILLIGVCAAFAEAQTPFVSVSAASYQNDALAPESIVAGFGNELATATQVATTIPLPTTMAGVTVRVRDSQGIERAASLFFVSRTQINYLLPAHTALGAATVTVRNSGGTTHTGTITVAAVAPGIFTAEASGRGWPAAQLLRVKSGGVLSYEPIARFDNIANRFVGVPVEFSAESNEELFLIVFGTGWRGQTSLAQVTATIGGTPVEVAAAVAQGSFAGLDQMNIRLPRTLAGRGETELAVVISGRNANPVKLAVKDLVEIKLFVANLRPEPNALSSASGVSTLKLSADEKTAVLRFDFGNLSAAKTAMHVRGPANPGATGPVLFDFDVEAPRNDGSYEWTLPASIVTELQAGRVYFVVQTSRYPAGELRGHYGLVTGSTTFTPPPPPPPLPSGTPTPRDAGRWLTQATFGPTTAEITRLQQRGYVAWLDEQFAKPRVKYLDLMDQLRHSGTQPGSNDLIEALWKQAVQGDDQLRQRVALALHELLVVSEFADGLSDNTEALATYYDLLTEHAFGNYRTLLEAVTLNPAMGAFQNVLRNDKEDPILGTVPNENYGRELLQLFSIGLNKLHPDGSLQLDGNGLPQPTYNQETVAGFARVLTGWAWGGNDANDPHHWYVPISQSWRIPMINFPNHHSTGEKRLLNGVLLPANQTAQKDLKDALDNVFGHPNVGPFICRQLIQKLVTSNPSPAYVYRVASVFNNNGSGVRGDLKAVVRAIMLDYEARSLDVVSQQGYGKLREPIMRLTTLLRAFRGTSPSGRYRYHYSEHPWGDIGQNFVRSPNVFNFFAPTFRYPGALSQAGLFAPEFQLANDATVIAMANYFKVFIFYGYDEGQHMVNLNYSEFTPLAGTPATLVDRLDTLMLSGAMSAGLRAALIKAVTAVPANHPTERVQTAVYLICFAPEFVIQK